MRHSRIKALPRELVTPVALAVLADRFLMDSPKEHRGIYGGEPATLDVPVQGVCGCWRTHIVRAELLGGASSSRSSAARQRRGRSRHARSRSSWIRRIISRLSSSVSRPASKRTKPSTTCSGMGRASGVSVCSMTARGWQSGPLRSQSEKCHRKFQLRRSRPPERPGRGCDRD